MDRIVNVALVGGGDQQRQRQQLGAAARRLAIFRADEHEAPGPLEALRGLGEIYEQDRDDARSRSGQVS